MAHCHANLLQEKFLWIILSSWIVSVLKVFCCWFLLPIFCLKYFWWSLTIFDGTNQQSCLEIRLSGIFVSDGYNPTRGKVIFCWSGQFFFRSALNDYICRRWTRNKRRIRYLNLLNDKINWSSIKHENVLIV
jgi:hypothetical protein